MADTLQDQLDIILSGAYDVAKVDYTALYQLRADSDVEAFDCKLDIQQHIRGLEFRRNGCDMQLDKILRESTASVHEMNGGQHREKESEEEIPKQSSEQRKFKTALWKTKREIYNQRIKALKDVYLELIKETYINHGAVDTNHKGKVRMAKYHYSKPIEENIQADIKKALSSKQY